jgi:hypothetical protein
MIKKTTTVRKRKRVFHHDNGKLNFMNAVFVPIAIALIGTLGTCGTPIALKYLDKVKLDKVQQIKAVEKLKMEYQKGIGTK